MKPGFVTKALAIGLCAMMLMENTLVCAANELPQSNTNDNVQVQSEIKQDPKIEETTEQSSSNQPSSEQPTSEQPTSEQPSTEQPTSEHATTEQPSTEQPTTEQPTSEQPTTEEPTSKEESLDPSLSENVIIEEEETPLTDSTERKLSVSVNGINITMTGELDAFPEDATLSATEIVEEGDGDIKGILDATVLAENAKTEEETPKEITNYKSFDIKLLLNGEEIEPSKPVKVAFTGAIIVPQKSEEELSVYHIEDGKDVANEMPVSLNPDKTEIEMETNHFSTYVITIKTDAEKITITTKHMAIVSGRTVINAPSSLTEDEVEVFRPSQLELYRSTEASAVELPIGVTDDYEVLSVEIQKKSDETVLYTFTKDNFIISGDVIKLNATDSPIKINEDVQFIIHYAAKENMFANKTTVFDYDVQSIKEQNKIYDISKVTKIDMKKEFNITSYRLKPNGSLLNKAKVDGNKLKQDSGSDISLYWGFTLYDVTVKGSNDYYSKLIFEDGFKAYVYQTTTPKMTFTYMGNRYENVAVVKNIENKFAFVTLDNLGNELESKLELWSIDKPFENVIIGSDKYFELYFGSKDNSMYLYEDSYVEIDRTKDFPTNGVVSNNAGINQYGRNYPDGTYLAMGQTGAFNTYALNINKSSGLMVNANLNNAFSNQQNGNYAIVPNLIDHLSDDLTDVVMGNCVINNKTVAITEPGYFNDTSLSGKKIYDNRFNLNFDQLGFTYSLKEMEDTVGQTIKTTSVMNKDGSISDRFFPLDYVNWNGSKNEFFGIRYDFTFKLGDYIGPLMYRFVGDDDIWVFVDGKRVLDLGGLHSAYPTSYAANNPGEEANEVDLWSAFFGITPEQRTEDWWKNIDGEKEHQVTVLYMERGGWDSSCFMEFVIPNVEGKDPIITEAPSMDISFKKQDAQTKAGLLGAKFKLTNEEGVESFATSKEDGIFTFTSKKAGTYTLEEVIPPIGYDATTEKWQVKVSGTTKENMYYEVRKIKEDNTVENELLWASNIDNGEAALFAIDNVQKVEDVIDLEHRKEAKLVGDFADRNYDITIVANSLAKRTTQESSTTELETPIDVVLVLDVSSSMGEGKDSRISNLRTGAKTFTTGLLAKSKESRIAIVPFDCTAPASKGDAVNKRVLEFTNNSSTLSTTIDGYSKGQHGYGTRQDLGLAKAKELINNRSNEWKERKAFVILFTDGAPTTAGSKNVTIDDILANGIAQANAIKASDGINGEIYVVQLDNQKEKYETWLKGLSSYTGDKTYYYEKTTKPENLAKIFDRIKDSITTTITHEEKINVTGVTIQDKIDKRFVLVAGEKERLQTAYPGIRIVENEDKTTTITWSSQTVAPASDSGAGWSCVIHVKARDEYIGGNDVYTNVGNDSFVNFTDEDGKTVKEELDKPKVNVDIALALGDAEDTIFLGENLTTYFIEEQQDKVYRVVKDGDGKITEIYASDKHFTMLDDVTILEGWFTSDDYAAKNAITVADIQNQSPREDTVYYAKVEVTPNSLANGEEGKENSLDQIAKPVIATGTYTVHVIDGQIRITKVISGKEYRKVDGDPIFTFKITRLEDSDCGIASKVYYKTVRFTESIVNNQTGDVSLYASIAGLEKGKYQVEELNTLAFTLSGKPSVVKADTNCDYSESQLMAAKKTVTFEIGYNFKEVNDNVISYVATQGHVQFKNKLSRTPGKLTHTDVVKNSFVMGPNGTISISTSEDVDNNQTQDLVDRTKLTMNQKQLGENREEAAE